MQIREIQDDELSLASRLLWQSFYDSEKKNTSIQGMEVFRDLTDPISLAMNRVDGSFRLFGAWKCDELVGVCGVKLPSHILLLYVHPQRKKMKIGSTMLSFLLEQVIVGDEATLNSSDEAVSFYCKYGFLPCGERREEQGILYTPMKKCNCNNQ